MPPGRAAALVLVCWECTGQRHFDIQYKEHTGVARGGVPNGVYDVVITVRSARSIGLAQT
ncbi:MAG: hypothetical protein FJW39_28915 [Acidobacteria bacterium]|nr:hypothetical protein [Acidobacteriota bacterium]